MLQRSAVKPAEIDFKGLLHSTAMGYFQPKSRKDLPSLCDSIALPPAPDDPAISKARYIESRLDKVPEQQAHIVLERFVAVHGRSLAREARYAIEERLWTRNPPFSIPKKRRHELARSLNSIPLFLKGDVFLKALSELFVLEDSFAALNAVFGNGRVVRVVEKPRTSPSGVSTLRDLPCRSARHVFPSIHPAELDSAAS